jgi:radical SAM superfamily enzyme YgiQ (UPF0313 family)
MKVALVGPELEENLALRYLHASLVAAGHDSRIVDFHSAQQTPALTRAILQYGPGVVGLSMVFTSRAREFIALAQELRHAGFEGHITAGGHFATFHAEQLLTGDATFDSVIHGEGEEALVDLIANLHRPEKVRGITCRGKERRLITTEPRRNPDDLDTRPLPTRPDRFHEYLGFPIANMLASRGCFGNCSFCSIQAWYRHNPGKRFRQRSTAASAREMAGLYHERGVRIFNFHDDNFFVARERDNVERFREFKRQLDWLGVGTIALQVKARPDSITPATLAALKALGLFRVFLGVESNSVAGLRTLGRGITRWRCSRTAGPSSSGSRRRRRI